MDGEVMVGVSRPGQKIATIGAPWLRVEQPEAGVVYLLRDEFTTAESAPLTSPRTCEPGPGELTVVDTENKFSITGGKLVGAGGKATPAWGDPRARGGSQARAAGLACLMQLNLTTNTDHGVFGWSTAGNAFSGFYIKSAAQINALSEGSAGASMPTVGSYAAATDYKLALILRNTGVFHAIKGGAYNEWTLLWVGDAGATAGQLPAYYIHSHAFTSNWLRTSQLSTPWDTDYGIATERLAGARTVGDTLEHEADCLIEFENDTLSPGGAVRFRFRIQDSNNCWYLYIEATGAMNLNEYVSGSPTSRASAGAGTLTGGERIVIVCDDEEIKVYYDNTLAFTYSSAANFKTATDGELYTLESGVIKDIISWPRTLSGAALSELNRYTR